MKYMLNIKNRKDLVKRIEKLTGTKGRYTGMPRLAYDFEGMSVNRYGDLEVEDFEANRNILMTLLSEGLIRTGQTETANMGNEPAWTEGEAEIAGDAGTVETMAAAEATGTVEEAEPADAGAEDNTAVTDQTGGEAATKAEHTAAEEISMVEEAYNPNLVKPNIAFPLDGHTGRSIRNLVILIYSRGNLISKATGGEFFASEDLINKTGETANFPTVESMTELIAEAGETGLKGIEIEDGKLIFTGFPASDDEERIQAFVHLASLMNRQALEQNRVQVKQVDESNEKYAFRTWLLRIGMNGNEYKTTRSLLMKRLNGHTAFKTPSEAKRWKARQAARREELKAAKAEAEATMTEAETALQENAAYEA